MTADTPQLSLAEWVQALDDAGLLHRYPDEKRVDELPQVMDDNPDRAVLVERVTDCEFPFFANGLQTREICALALDCDPKMVSNEIGHRSRVHQPAELVDSAPCQEVVLTGDDVDLTIFPLFQHHTNDGQAYLNDGRIITADPDSGEKNDAVQRLMYRAKNLLSIDERALNHGGSINASHHHELKQDTPVAVCIGGPTLDQISSMMRSPGAHIDCWDKLGGYLGQPAQIVKCQTVDLTIPANAEIVLEGHIITTEDWIHDEGPYGEYTGTYGSDALAHNWNLRVDCITYRRGAIYQHASIGGLHPGRTDMFIWLPAIEGELFGTLEHAGIGVTSVRSPYGSGGNMMYASIKPVSGGDAKQALGTMLTACRQHMPKIAYVFDDDIDIYDDERVMWAQTWRYNPGTDTLLIPGQNMNPLDPSLTMAQPPYSITKAGFDCTMTPGKDHSNFLPALITPPIGQPSQVTTLTEDEIAAQMSDLITQSPRNWGQILEHFAGQPYRLLYRAFGQLRPRLGRIADHGPDYPYTFADHDFVYPSAGGHHE